MERAAILCKGPPGEGVGECTARRASTIPWLQPGKKQFSFRLRKRLLSCARARPAGHWGCRSRATKSPWSQSESMQAVYDHYAYTESVVFQPINILHILEYRFVSDIFALQDFTPVCVLYHHQPEESLLLHASLHRISL